MAFSGNSSNSSLHIGRFQAISAPPLSVKRIGFHCIYLGSYDIIYSIFTRYYQRFNTIYNSYVV